MRAALILLLLCDSQHAETPVTHALRFLARHQAADGSWGRFDPSCACGARLPIETPLAIPVDAEVEPRFHELLEHLGGDGVRNREEAQRKIQDLGTRAVPLLQRSLSHRDVEVAIRSRQALEAIWSSNPEVRRLTRAGAPAPEEEFPVIATGLGLLCFLGAGYSDFSKDQFIDTDGRVFDYGAVVRKASDWLRSRQGPDGAFAGRHALAQAIATTAMSEHYGITASAPLKEPTIKAVSFLKTLASADPDFLIWKGTALHSAHFSELPETTDEDCARIAVLLGKGDSPLTLAGALVFASCRKLGWERVRGRLAEFESTELTPIETWMMTSAILSSVPREQWVESPWIQCFTKEIRAAQCRRPDCESGSWVRSGEHREQRLITTLYTTLAMERNYQYTCALFVLGQGK